MASADAASYAAWPNGPSPSNNPSFWPIGVWLQSPPNVAEFKNIGINMYIGFYGSLDEGSLSSLAASAMPLVPGQNSVGLSGAGNWIIQGWDQMDEPDNAQPNGSGGYEPCVSPATVVAAYNAIRTNDVSRPVMLNFGRGVSDINYVGRGTCSGDTNYYVQASLGGDILSFDLYPVADYGGQLELISQGVDNLKRWSGNQEDPLALCGSLVHQRRHTAYWCASQGGSLDVSHSRLARGHVPLFTNFRRHSGRTVFSIIRRWFRQLATSTPK